MDIKIESKESINKYPQKKISDMLKNRLNTRTIIVLDEDNKVLYVEYAKDATQSLNLSEAIKYVD